MNFQQYEDNLVDRLQRDDVDVQNLPFTNVLNTPRNTATPQLFVLINGISFADPENLGGTAQAGTVQGEIYMRAKERRGDLGIYDLYNWICRRLLGYRIPGAKGAITLDQFGYVSGIQNQWQYSVTFSFQSYEVEQPDQEPDAPPVGEDGNPILIKKITTNTHLP